ncbi:MAG: transcriptional regulator [Cyclobacteriaceae bacterium]
MNIKLIKTEEDYEAALARLEDVFDAAPDTPEGDEAEILSLLIESYEDKHFPIEAPDPVDAIKIRMEEMGLKQKDLVGLIGGKSRVSEILSRKKKLTVEMIRILEQKLKLSASMLVKDYDLKPYESQMHYNIAAEDDSGEYKKMPKKP